ncbi:alkaline phosphatase family protein [Pseudomonas granadensis]|uniref:alkaline phosphatase D family protein n=1 Tax=Pseudomonas granadensis TaxID=1421430 RepID=UPI0019D195E0|nr:alkaline phosphatase D family protein [Pseudomonas granadensis]MBN6772943.1 alkaline phosphatase family protein [Pseudomonas granadensis]MBN6803871.1 alkaline phosphatase family protein [Pseudomonas granadensis]MBN6830550.1 alkaline phosphatase family protein [Pseudomonas granadensis]MBN6838092.1 alkaline phosphatase family protein [Pseudomonas granadensis]MBN6867454.1 alkaline phosphatase family protein [Pseudomonas granadensis]
MLKPTIGPIVGHVTTNHARVFLRGDRQNNSRVFAAVRCRPAGAQQWSKGIFAHLSATRDMSHVFALNNLSTDTEYEYQAGWFSPMSPVHTPDSVAELPLQWPREIYRLRTRSSKPMQPRAYIVGSCRYLRMTAGIASLPQLGDRIFASINQVIEGIEPPISAVLMTGDQIYVDDLNLIAPDREYQDILRKYRAALSQPNIKRLMSGTSTYMILDDHEIEDNWPANANKSDVDLFRNAMAAYELYQASHSPVHPLTTNGEINRSSLEHYWYQFSDGDIEWFVTDSRTRRNLSADDRRILDEAQEQALLKWLIHSEARVKFVVTSVMFYPDRKLHGDDAWKAFPEQRLRLLETIRTRRIMNVVFISGDVHGSLTARLSHSEDPDFEVHTVVSSPLCNSKLLPYAKASTFILDQPLVRTAAGDYRHELTSTVVSEDNFAHLVVEARQIQVNYHDRDGKRLQSIVISLL